MTEEFFNNPANKEKIEALSLLSDIHKDAYGFRPRNYDFEAMTLQDILDETERVYAVSLEEMKAQKEADKVSIKRFKELLVKTIGLGAKTFDKALEWLFDGSGIERDEPYGVEEFLYRYDIDMYTTYGHIIKKRLENILY